MRNISDFHEMEGYIQQIESSKATLVYEEGQNTRGGTSS